MILCSILLAFYINNNNFKKSQSIPLDKNRDLVRIHCVLPTKSSLTINFNWFFLYYRVQFYRYRKKKKKNITIEMSTGNRLFGILVVTKLGNYQDALRKHEFFQI